MKKFLLIFTLSILIPLLTSFAEINENTVSMQLIPEGELSANKTTIVKLKLSDIKDGSVINEDDLSIAHTKKLHLLVIDPTLTDYQHIHPTRSENSDEFVFAFTPKIDGMYRVWADITRSGTNKQEYVVADIGSEPEQKPALDRSTYNESIVDGYKFKLLFDSELRAGSSSEGTIKIEDKEGNPVTKLEPVMGAFAHIVGFSQDFKNVVHIHPMGKEPESDVERGGPELIFHIEPKDPGFIKLFAQVKIDGKEIFVPFGLSVSNTALAMN